MRGRERWTSNHAYRLGGDFDDRARAWLTQSRFRWILLGFLAYSLFEALAPFAALAPGYARVLEGIGFALVVVLVAWAVARKRA
jgi:hypothetical protein